MACRKHGGPKRRVWRKVHLGIDEETLENRAVEITGSDMVDSPVLPDLSCQIPIGEEIGSVTADGAYETCTCHDTIADRGVPAAIPSHRKREAMAGSRPPVPQGETRSSGHPRHESSGINPPGERGRSAITRFVQQSSRDHLSQS